MLNAKDLYPNLSLCNRKGQKFIVVNAVVDRDGYLLSVNLLNVETAKVENFNKTVFREFGFYIIEEQNENQDRIC